MKPALRPPVSRDHLSIKTTWLCPNSTCTCTIDFNLSKETTFLLRPLVCGPKVVAIDRFHCITIRLLKLLIVSFPYSQNELLASQHYDVNSVACIEEKCRILGLKQYCRLACVHVSMLEGGEWRCVCVGGGLCVCMCDSVRICCMCVRAGCECSCVWGRVVAIARQFNTLLVRDVCTI